MKLLIHITACLAIAGGPAIGQEVNQKQALPNILLILADDLGYGDVSCYNKKAKVNTPRMDQLAAEGMRFTDAHSPATVCTPTRYSVMTGRMAFRTGKFGVFTGVGGPCMIEKERLTLPELLKGQGYHTAMFGKWHIGLSFFDKDGKRIREGGVEGVRRIDYSRAIPDAPIHHGFDEFFGTACCPTTDWLYAFIDGDRIPVPPTKLVERDAYPNNVYTRDFRQGLIAADFDIAEIDNQFLEKSLDYLDRHAQRDDGKPFFLMHSTQAVHLPSIPAAEYRGKSRAGPHGDFILQMDGIVGKLMAKLDEHDLASNTLLILTSDNGPEVPTVVNMRNDHEHDGARPWRGMKRDQWEGGHRVPLLMRWPEGIMAGSVSKQTVSLTDIMATCAALTEAKLPNDAAQDSYNILPVLKGIERNEPIRPYTLQQTWSKHFSIRVGQWKYLDHQGSGGNNYRRKSQFLEGLEKYIIEDTAPDAAGQLYNLAEDPGETTNLYFKHPEKVKEMKALLDQSLASGRSAPLRQ
ncbi:MAG: sulfatase family protein [Luteolibacter sp.]